MAKTNLPPDIKKDSANDTKDFFDSYYTDGISLSSNEIDSTVGFFQSKGFDISAATSVAATLLSQSKIEKVNIFKILDTLKGLNSVELTQVVKEILNYNRLNISTLGYRVDTSENNQYEIRNVLA